MTLKLSILCFATIILLSCKKDDDDDSNFSLERIGYERGVVWIQMNQDVFIEQFFDLMNDEELAINQVHTSRYTSSLPVDSLSYVSSILQSKSYVVNNGVNTVSFDVANDTISAYVYLHDMDNKAQMDWLVTKKKLELASKQPISAIVNVEPDQEMKWIDILKQKPDVGKVTLNYWVVN